MPRENNFGKGAIEGVFTLGQDSKENIEVIEKKQEALTIIKNDIFKYINSLIKQQGKKNYEEERFKEESWRLYKNYEACDRRFV